MIASQVGTDRIGLLAAGPDLFGFCQTGTEFCMTPKKAPFLCLQGYLDFGSSDLAQNFTDCLSPGHAAA